MPAESLRVSDKRQTQDSQSQAAAPRNPAPDSHVVPLSAVPAEDIGREWGILLGGRIGLWGTLMELDLQRGGGLGQQRGGLGWSPEGAFTGRPCPAPGGRARVSFLLFPNRSCSGTPRCQPSSNCREVPAGPVK